MKSFGLVGGMSEYAAEFYLDAIEKMMVRLEGRRADVVMRTGTIWRVGQLAREGRWDDVVTEIVGAARDMRRAGAEFVVIPSFSLHRVADAVMAESGVPILRLDDCVVEKVAQLNCQEIAVLGAGTQGDEFTKAFYGQLVNSMGQEMQVYGALAGIEFGPITLANQPCDKRLRRKHLFTYLEEVKNVEDYVKVIFNCSVEMTRMIGRRTAQCSVKSRAGWVPIINAMDLHVRAIVQACRE